LNIFLDNVGESITVVSNGATYTVTSNFNAVDGGDTGGDVSGFGTLTSTIAADAFTTIHITDGATTTSVTFGASGANAYSSAIDIVLDDPTAGGLTFTGASNFAGGLEVSVTGDISQSAPVTSQTPLGVSLTSTGGSITLTNAANNFSSVSLETSGANAIAFRTLATLSLDHVTTESGDVTITAGAGIGQTNTGRLDIGGTTTFDITGGSNVTISLAQANNFFGGPVIITESGGDIGSINLRNVSPTAALPDLTDLSTGDLSVLQLIYDGTGITVDAATEDRVAAAGALFLKAGGPIGQTAPITLATLTAIALGNNGITLTDAGNSITGDVSLNNEEADGGAASAVSYFENGAVSLGASHLGLGTLSITAATGNITQTGPITQRLGAGTATFTAVAGDTINLGLTGNLFAGPVHFLGAAVTDVQLRNANTLAALPDLSDVTDTLTDLTLNFEHAPMVLPAYTLQNLTVNADGIYQQPGTALLISNNADFSARSFKLDLSNTGNDFSTLRLRSTGFEDVRVFDLDDVAFGGGNSDVGQGRLTITAGGAITQLANRIRQAAGGGPATFTAPSITLDRTTNDFTGEVVLNTPGAATLVDTNSIILGDATVGGNLTVSAVNNITQLAGSALSVTGASNFDSGGGANVIALNNPGNALAGTVQFTDGNVTFQNTVAVTFSGANSVGSLRVTAGGLITQVAGSSLVVSGASSFDAGANPIDLNLAGNNFQGSVAVTSTGTVTLRDLNAIQLGNVRLGAGAFTVNATGNITQAGGTSITQSGPGALSFLGGAANNVTLNQAGNDFSGPITVDANSVTILAVGDVNFASGADIDGNLTVTAGGTLTLPTVAANLNDLNTVNLAAARILVGSNLATDGGTGIAFNGAVQFASGVTVNTSASTGPIRFTGDVTAGGALTFNTGTQSVFLNAGSWNQGANSLTITSTGATAFEIGDGIGAPATFTMSGGTLGLNVSAGGIALRVAEDGTFHVGAAGTAETVTIDTGGVNTTVLFDAESALEVGFGTTNDQLVVNGIGNVAIDGARLIGSGVAGASPSPVLQLTGGGTLSGAFGESLAIDGTAQAFLAGSDIVTASYLPTSASIGSGGPAPAASFSGFLPDGDKYTVTHSGGAAAGLVVIENARGQIDVVVRNNTAAGTLTITTTKFSGEGLTDVGGIGVNGAGAITIKAATSNVHGDIRVESALTSLTVRDVLENSTTSQPQLIRAGGAASALTNITGHVFDGVQIEIGSTLNKLKLAAFGSTNGFSEPALITAEKFGMITITGDAAANISGDLDGRLTNRNTLNSPAALTSATAAHLSGTWDLAGSVGKVTATVSTAAWILGASGPGAVHVHGVSSAGTLSLADISVSTLSVNGAISSFKATQVSTVGILAQSMGSFSVVANPAQANQFGLAAGLTLMLTGNKAGMALKSFLVAASLQSSSLHFLDGNVGTFTVGREFSDSTLVADATTAGGRFTTIKVGRWDNTDLDAKSVGSLKAIGNATAGEFGDILDSSFMLRGNLAGLALGTLSASGTVDTNTFVLTNGGVTTFTAARGLADSTITLSDATLGNLKSISAGFWNNTDLTARTVGTLKVTGAPQVGPASSLLVGDVTSSAILAFLDTTNVPGIGTFSVAGDLDGSSVVARNGIKVLTVARAFEASSVVADNVVAGQLAVGRIGTLKVGDWNGSSVVATTLGKVSTTGYTTQEGAFPTQFTGAFVGGTLLANGAAPSGAKNGIDSLTIAGSVDTPTITARSGVGSFTVRGVLEGARLTFDDPLNVTASGKVGKVSVGAWLDSTIRANVLGTLQTIPSAKDGATGEFINPGVTFVEITVAGSGGSAADPVALTSFLVAEDLEDTRFNIPGGVKTFKVAGVVSDSDIAAGFGANARLASVTAGAWENTDLTTRALSAMNVTGQPARAIAGNVSDSLLTIMSNKANVGIGTFTAQGTVENSTFQVTDGNVNSFIAGKFLDSRLYVGFRPDSVLDLTQSGTFGLTDRTLKLFKTTQAFSPTDPDSISFQDSFIVAADLGTITLTGVGTDSDRPTIFGVGFETGGTAGVVKANVGAGLVTLAPPFISDAFTFTAL
jgi:hypothetical protein